LAIHLVDKIAQPIVKRQDDDQGHHWYSYGHSAYAGDQVDDAVRLLAKEMPAGYEKRQHHVLLLAQGQ
jgi:hypothetical protein